MFNSGNTLTATINFSNGTTAEKKFFVDVAAHDVDGLKLELTTPSALQVSFQSKEAGKIYYLIKDEDGYGPKTLAEIFEKGQTQPIKSGANTLQPIEAEEKQWFLYAIEDEYGNRMTFNGHEEVPAYKPSVPDEEDNELKVAKIEFEKDEDLNWDGHIMITFNQAITITYLKQPREISGIDGNYFIVPEYTKHSPTTTLKFDLRDRDYTTEVRPGAHEVTFTLTYEDKNGNLAEKTFVETFITD